MRDRLSIVSAERIRDELDKLLVGARAVRRAGAARRARAWRTLFLPELPALQLEQDPVHRHKDVLRHTYAVVERCEPRSGASARGAAARHRQAEDAGDHPRRRAVPPPRGRRRADGARRG